MMQMPLVAFEATMATERPEAALAAPRPPEAPWPWLAPAQASEPRAETPTPVAELCWDDTIRQHERRVVVTLLARGIPLERAKELTQEAWFRLIRQHRAGKLSELRFPGVAIRQALFLAREAQRRHSRRRGKDPGLGDSSAADPERLMIARDELRLVERVLERSSPTARRVFRRLYGHAPRTPREVADELGLSLQRVRQIVCELRKKMRRELEVDHG